MQTDPSPRPADAPQQEWPTTLRFSRRLGETVRGAEYAVAIEGADGPWPVLIHATRKPRPRMGALLARLLCRHRKQE